MLMLLGLIAVCLGWLVPGHFYPWLSFQQEVVAGTGGALIGFAALRANTAVRWPWLAMCVAALAAVPLLQLAFGQIRFVSDGVLAALYLAAFALAMVAGATLAQSPRRNELVGGLWAALLVAGIASTGMALAQWTSVGAIGYVGDVAHGWRPYANLGQPNHLALLLAMAAAAALWLYETRRIHGPVAALTLAWLGTGLVATQSRAGWLLVLFIGVAVVLARRWVPLRTTALGAVAAVALFFALASQWGLISDAMLVSALPLEHRLRAGPRMMLWQALLAAAKDAPWLGYGWTQVGLATQASALDHVTQRGVLTSSHNVLIDLVLWNGVPLALLIAGAFAAWFAMRVRRCRSVEGMVLLVGVALVFVHELLEFPLEYAYFLLPAGLMMGVLDGDDAVTVPRRAPRASLALPLGVATALMAWVAVEYIQIEEASRQQRFVLAGIGVDMVPHVPPPEVRLLDAPLALHEFWQLRPHAGMSAQQLDWMRRVQQRHAVPAAQVRYAIAAGLNGQPQEAADALIRMCHMHNPRSCAYWVQAWPQVQRTFPQLALAFPERARRALIDPS